MLALSRIPTADGDCSVCHEDFKKEEEVVGHTGDHPHPAHEKCLRKWVKRSSTCPICRVAINNRFFIPLTEKINMIVKKSIAVAEKAAMGGAIAGFIAGRLGSAGIVGGAAAGAAAGKGIKVSIGAVAISLVLTLAAGFFQVIDLNQSHPSIAGGGMAGGAAGALAGTLAGAGGGALAVAHLLKTGTKAGTFLGAAAGIVAIAGAGTSVMACLGAEAEVVAVASAITGVVAAVISEMWK